MKYIKFFVLLAAAGILIAYSCKKEEKNDADDILAAQENALASNLWDDVFKQVSDASKQSDDSCSGTKGFRESLTGGCATITISSIDTVFPKTITVDFGTVNCQGTDYRYRRGKLIYTISTWYRDSGCTITVTPDNYYVDDYKVVGTKTIKNLGRDTDSLISYEVSVVNATIIAPNGTTFSWNTTRTNKWVAGESTVLWPFDDEYEITGSANGINSNGVSYVINITTPLLVQFGCRWIKSGVLTVNVDSHPTITVNYGDGSCDPNATAEVNGTTYNFVMN